MRYIEFNLAASEHDRGIGPMRGEKPTSRLRSMRYTLALGRSRASRQEAYQAPFKARVEETDLKDIRALPLK